MVELALFKRSESRQLPFLRPVFTTRTRYFCLRELAKPRAVGGAHPVSSAGTLGTQRRRACGRSATDVMNGELRRQ